MDQVAHDIVAFHKNPDGNVTMENFAGYLQWEEWFAEQKELEANMEDIPVAQAVAPAAPAVPLKKLSFKEKHEFDNMEQNIQEKEAKLTAAQKELDNPEVAARATRVQELYTEISQLQAEIEQMYARWTELGARAEVK
ncbi:ABC transporter ATPase component [compost metagenome]